MRGLPFVTTYIDDVLIHSVHEELHKSHLEQAFQCLLEAGLTLRGSKCQIGVAQVTYLGHAFGVKKSHITTYHPQGDGMVERLSCLLLQLLRTYMERQKNWENNLYPEMAHTYAVILLFFSTLTYSKN